MVLLGIYRRNIPRHYLSILENCKDPIEAIFDADKCNVGLQQS